MIMLPILTRAPRQGNAGFIGLLPGLAALAAVLTGVRYAVWPFFRVVVRARSREIFTAASLLLVFSIAALISAVTARSSAVRCARAQLRGPGRDRNQRETFASGLETAHAMLRCLGFTEKKAAKMISVFREHDEAILDEQRRFCDNEKLFIDYTNRARLQLAEVFRRELAGEDKEKD